jgi:hypothetical protein
MIVLVSMEHLTTREASADMVPIVPGVVPQARASILHEMPVRHSPSAIIRAISATDIVLVFGFASA